MLLVGVEKKPLCDSQSCSPLSSDIDLGIMLRQGRTLTSGSPQPNTREHAGIWVPSSSLLFLSLSLCSALPPAFVPFGHLSCETMYVFDTVLFYNTQKSMFPRWKSTFEYLNIQRSIGTATAADGQQIKRQKDIRLKQSWRGSKRQKERKEPLMLLFLLWCRLIDNHCN